jgi:uncharacterized membrane protein YtjA (UPF0391 family)
MRRRRELDSLKGGHHDMLNWAIAFLIIAIIAGVLGFTGIAGLATSIAKILFLIFLVAFVLTLVFGRRRVIVLK